MKVFAKRLGLFTLVAVLMAGTAWGQTTLSAGDIAIIAFNFDNPDELGFVALTDIETNTVIKFTDNGWYTAGGFRTGEGTHTWTAGTNYTPGDVIQVTLSGPALSSSGDQILAYQGDESSPTFIFAINSEGTDWQSDATSSNTSALPTGLTEGTTAIAFNEVDNGYYSGSTTGTKNELLNLICNKSNWTTNDTGPLSNTLWVSSFTVNTSSPSVTVSADPSLTEGNLDGAEVDITLLNETFADGTLSSGNFTLNNAPTGVTVNSVAYGTTTTATLTLAFDGTDFDADVSDFNITVAGAELTGGSPLTSNNLSISHVAEEPANHVTSFSGAVISDVMAKVTWTDNNDAGDPADGFLLEGYPSGSGASSFSPVDGNASPSNTNSVFVWVGTGVEEHTFTGLTKETQYTVRIWPYSGSGSAINYKTDPTIPSVTATTDAAHTVIGLETFDASLGVMTAVDVTGDVVVWSHNSTGGSAQANGYVYGGVGPEEEWLVSPAMNLDNFSDDVLYFQTAYKYGVQDANNYLKAYYTTAYTTPDASSWTEIPFLLPQAQETMSNSGLLDISGISGTDVVFAFKYYSTDNPRRWDVDNIYLTGIALVTASAPEVSTGSASDVTHESATLNGWVDANFADATVTFEYGKTTSYGSSVTAAQSPVSGGDIQVDVSASLSGLDPETTYHFRVKAVNSEGTTYGDDATFTTDAAPVLPNAWINEIHYDDDSGDLTEFVEIVIENASSYTLSDFTLELYNGNGGAKYNTSTVDGFSVGNTTGNFSIYYKNFSNTIQNGAPDGLALSYQDNLIQFLSYEGTFTAIDGNAVSVLSTDIGVKEDNSSFSTSSLQLIGSGTTYSDFTWDGPFAATKGLINSDGSTEQALPITLASFTANYLNGAVKLAWKTASETENAAFRIYRDGAMIAELEGGGTTSEPQDYTYTDQYVIPGQTYTYVLADVSDGNVEVKHGDMAVTVTAAEGDVVKDFVIGAAYPNPFNPVTVVPLNLVKEAMVHAQLYDITGRPLTELHNGALAAGSHALTVNGANLSTGIYFVRININDAMHVQKIALMK